MLNDSQEQAVYYSGGCLLITAPPGSGKTSVLKERALYLLKNNPNAKLAAVTFTSDAAKELEERILKANPDLEDRLIAGTFHALCKKQLTGHINKLVLINENQQNAIIYRAVLETRGDSVGKPSASTDVDDADPEGEKVFISLDDAKAYIDWRKSQVDPILSREKRDQICEGIYLRYEEALEQMGGMDFTDLMMKAVKGMKEGVIRPIDVEYMLVDEFQDTDEIQYSWVYEHFKNGTEVTVVGDDDQSIYGWRRALGYGGMERFRQRMNAGHISLNTSYRCTRAVLEPAALLISHNVERVEKMIQTANTGQGRAVATGYSDHIAEVEGMLATITRSGKRRGWAVLARGNVMLDELIKTLPVDLKEQFRRKGGKDFWELRGPALFLGVCESLVYGNMVGVDALLRQCGLGDERLKRLHVRYPANSKSSLRDFMNDNRDSKSTDVVSRLGKFMSEWDNSIKGKAYATAYAGISHFIIKNASLYEGHKIGAMLDNDVKSINACGDILLKGRKGSLEYKVQNARRKSDDKDDDVVKVMTLHSSKGLEFENVWILGCEQGIIPSENSVDIDEERRLFYVGMTRAKTNLFVSYTKKDVSLSQFITEAGLQIR